MSEAPLQKLKRLVKSKPMDMLGKKKEVAKKMSHAGEFKWPSKKVIEKRNRENGASEHNIKRGSIIRQELKEGKYGLGHKGNK